MLARGRLRRFRITGLARPEVLGQFGAVRVPRLLQDIVHMHFHRSGCQRQGTGDVLVVLSHEGVAQHLLLARGELVAHAVQGQEPVDGFRQQRT